MKNTLRQKAKSIRKTLDTERISEKLTELIRQNETYKNSKNILLYYPLKYEMNFLGLLKDDKNFYFPRVSGEEMLVCPYTECTKLKKSTFGIYEPCSTPCNPSVIDLAIVPALFVDKNQNRLGYGGGFYDRFLSANRNIKTICAIPENMVIEKIPTEEFDIPIDIIISSL